MIGIGWPRWREVSGVRPRRGRCPPTPGLEGSFYWAARSWQGCVIFFFFKYKPRWQRPEAPGPRIAAAGLIYYQQVVWWARLAKPGGQKKTGCHRHAKQWPTVGLLHNDYHTSESTLGQFLSLQLLLTFAGLLAGKLAFASNSHLWNEGEFQLWLVKLLWENKYLKYWHIEMLK